jgi:hypothetical protein
MQHAAYITPVTTQKPNFKISAHKAEATKKIILFISILACLVVAINL